MMSPSRYLLAVGLIGALCCASPPTVTRAGTSAQRLIGDPVVVFDGPVGKNNAVVVGITVHFTRRVPYSRAGYSLGHIVIDGYEGRLYRDKSRADRYCYATSIDAGFAHPDDVLYHPKDKHRLSVVIAVPGYYTTRTVPIRDLRTGQAYARYTRFKNGC